MKIMITGGSGLVGRALTNKFQSLGREVIWLSRSQKERIPKGVKVITHLSEDFSVDIVINLAGSPIAVHWNEANKEKILNSRIDTTQRLVSWISKLQNPPKLLISASAVGFFGDSGEHILDESSLASDKSSFTHKVCSAWEAKAKEVEKVTNGKTKVAITRFGHVLSADGGFLKPIIMATHFGGGYFGSGQQWISWVHINDLVNAIIFLVDRAESLQNESLWNLTSPHPVRSKIFTAILKKSLNKKIPCQINIPAFIAKILLGESSFLMLASVRTCPQELLSAGFDFHFSSPVLALKDILSQQKS